MNSIQVISSTNQRVTIKKSRGNGVVTCNLIDEPKEYNCKGELVYQVAICSEDLLVDYYLFEGEVIPARYSVEEYQRSAREDGYETEDAEQELLALQSVRLDSENN